MPPSFGEDEMLDFLWDLWCRVVWRTDEAVAPRTAARVTAIILAVAFVVGCGLYAYHTAGTDLPGLGDRVQPSP